MKLFSWPAAIILIVISAVVASLIGGRISSNYNLGSSMLITAFVPVIITFYFIAWVLMWNCGKAESPFKLAIDLLSK